MARCSLRKLPIGTGLEERQLNEKPLGVLGALGSWRTDKRKDSHPQLSGCLKWLDAARARLDAPTSRRS